MRIDAVVCHLTELAYTYTEVPLDVDAQGRLVLELQPLAFALVEEK